MSRYDNRNALILGAGRSGLAAARLLLERGGRVAVVDETWPGNTLSEFAFEGISCLTSDRDHLPDGAYDLVIVSPSFGLNHPWVQIAQRRGLAMISELELGANYWKGELIAITGSKGKSSVVKCIAETLTLAGIPATIAGNYGIPLCTRVLDYPEGGKGVYAVTEVSSFQLEHTRTFSPCLAAILNIQADHLDRHETLEAYSALKRKIFQAQVAGKATAFLPKEISILGVPQGVPVETFGIKPWDMWRYHDGNILHGETAIPVTGVFNNKVLGPAAALITAILTHLKVTPEIIAKGFEQFQPLPHRLQRLGSLNGITIIDDSKATSLSATQAALKIVGKNVHLIAGGLLKEDDLDFLDMELSSAVKKAYLIGKAAPNLYEAWEDLCDCECCGEMETAVEHALANAQPGDTLLLSPGCASFDQYDGMAKRGDHFKKCVEAHGTLE